jgi:hypothetical protein
MLYAPFRFSKYSILTNYFPPLSIESGIISIFYQSGKGQKRKGAETERSMMERAIKERSIIHFCSKPERGIQETNIKRRGIINFVTRFMCRQLP